MIDKGGSVYKIRDRNTGLFSTGGGRPSWRKAGKVWNGMGPLKNHLRCVLEYTYPRGKGKIPESWEVVEYRIEQPVISNVTLATSLIV